MSEAYRENRGDVPGADRVGGGRGTGALWEPARHAFPAGRLDDFLVWAAESGASDVALQTGSPAFVEVDGKLRRATSAVLGRTEMEMLVEGLFNETGVSVLRSGGAIDCSKTVQRDRRERRRFRVNISPAEVDHSFAVSVALRVMPEGVPTLEELGIEPEIVGAWELCTGLTLVTGIPGSGKSTLLAAGTRRLLENGSGRIQSFEAPIEYVFDGIGGEASLMSSAEIPRHFSTFGEGLRSSLRRRPAAVLVGEARDRETVEAVVRAADYGIAVYSTAHTTGVAATIRRMLAEFPAEERDERGAALVDVLHLVVTQVLVASPGGGRKALREWLVFGSELKGALLERPQREWPGMISGRLADGGTDLLGAAEMAVREGSMGRSDYLRIRAAAGLRGGDA